MLRDLVLKNRSYRRFDEGAPIDRETLRDLVDLARLSPSGGNMQTLKFMLACTPEENARIFPHLGWAGYLPDWDGPAEGERPTAYVIVLGDKDISQGFGCEVGIVAQTIMLGATEKGFGGCMIGNIRRAALYEALGLPAGRFEIQLVLALGKPGETVRLEPMAASGDLKYWRDERGVHHVPKRSLEDMIVS